jgi:hypothetical protein
MHPRGSLAYTFSGNMPRKEMQSDEDHGLEGSDRSCPVAQGAVSETKPKIRNKKRKVRDMRYRIRLETMADVNKFVVVAGKVKGKLTLTDGENFTVNGKSLLGAMYTFEWERIYCESDNEIYHLIKDFLVEESDPIIDN